MVDLLAEYALCQSLALLALEDGTIFEELVDLGLGSLLLACFGELDLDDPAPTVTDEGGERLHLDGAWLDTPHTVTIEGLECYSGRSGEGMRPVPAGGMLRIIVPADLPVGGPYDITVTWGGDAPGETVLPSLITVVRRVRRIMGYDIPAMFPAGPYARGPARLDQGPILSVGAEVPATVDLLKAVLGAISQALTEFGGLYFTRLTAALNPGTAGAPGAGYDTANVESTHEWPDAGTVIIQGEVITYATKTATTLDTLTRDDSVTEVYPEGTPVVLWTRDQTAIERARAGMVVGTAEAEFLDVVGGNLGVPRYQGAEDSLYRRMIRALAYLPGKGSPASLDILLDLLLDGQGLTWGDGTITNGNEISSIIGGFTARMVGLRVRLYDDNEHIYRIAEVVDDNNIVLDTSGSTRWRAADLDNDTPVTWHVLPWDVHADPWRPGVAVIRVLGPEGTSPIGFAYLNGGEVQTPDDNTHVTVDGEIRQVLGVWLATDTDRSGLNYADDNNFAGSVITLNTALPGTPDVIVDYGSVDAPTAGTTGVPGSAYGPGTAQLLKDVTWRNPVGAVEAAAEGYAVDTGAPRYPLYLGDRLGYIIDIIRVIVVAGVRPELEFFMW